MDFDHVMRSQYDSPSSVRTEEVTSDVRKGPWTAEEDALLANHVKIHGEGRWNLVARRAGRFLIPHRIAPRELFRAPLSLTQVENPHGLVVFC